MIHDTGFSKNMKALTLVSSASSLFSSCLSTSAFFSFFSFFANYPKHCYLKRWTTFVTTVGVSSTETLDLWAPSIQQVSSRTTSVPIYSNSSLKLTLNRQHFLRQTTQELFCLFNATITYAIRFLLLQLKRNSLMYGSIMSCPHTNQCI